MRNWQRGLVLASLAGAFFSHTAFTQVPAGASTGGPLPLGALRTVDKMDWHIFGKVTTVNGDPVSDARVKIDIGVGNESVKYVETNFRGEFRTDFNLEAISFKQLSVKVTATKSGFRDALENVDFGSGDKTWGIDLILRGKEDDPDQLSQEGLIDNLAPGLREAAADEDLESARKDFERGVELFLDKHEPVKAVPLLAKVVDKQPDCVECRTLLGLALLDAGSWAGATRQLTEAAKQSETQAEGASRAQSLLILGVLEAWKREDKKAAGFMMQALELDPQNPFILQELGRVLIVQKNWEAADQYLERAIKAGALGEVHLLRARALLEEGDLQEANSEMKKYLAGRDVKEFPVSVRSVYAQLHDRMNMEPFGRGKSLVTESLPQLTKAIPEVKGIEPAQDQQALPEILRKTGENVEAFFHTFPDTVSLEQIREERLGKDGKIKDSLDQKFQYLLLARAEKWGVGLEEFRTNSRGDRTAPGGLTGGFMLTSGFASASLLFHPSYQSGAKFRFLGQQAMGDRQTNVVAFAQRPETAQMVERFNADEASALVLLQGLAWIDAQTYRIVRLRTELLRPLSQVRLQRQTTEISYDTVQFKDMTSAMWLPREVAVTVEWKGKTFHNLHRYSDFKLFHIETKEKAKPLDLPQASETKPE